MIGDLILEDSIIADREDLGDKDPIDAFVRRSVCVVVGVERTIGVEFQFLFEEPQRGLFTVPLTIEVPYDDMGSFAFEYKANQRQYLGSLCGSACRM